MRCIMLENMITTTDLPNQFKKELRAFVPKKTKHREKSTFSLIKNCFDDIIETQKNGATAKDICQILKNLNIEITEQVLRNYLCKIKKERQVAPAKTNLEMNVYKEKLLTEQTFQYAIINKLPSTNLNQLATKFPKGDFVNSQIYGSVASVTKEKVILKVTTPSTNIFSSASVKYAWFETRNFKPEIIEILFDYLKRPPNHKVTINSATVPHIVNFLEN